MKRKTVITAKNGDTKMKITVELEGCQRSCLTRDEEDDRLNRLVDSIVVSIIPLYSARMMAIK